MLSVDHFALRKSCDRKVEMPFVRRRRAASTSLSNSQMEAQGLAWLCFAQDHSWFQGTISTDDESNYSLIGTRIIETAKVPHPEEDEGDLSEEEDSLSLGLGELQLTEGGSCGESTESSCSESDLEFHNNNNINNVPSTTMATTMATGAPSKPITEEYYRVILTDHFSGLRYQLPKISVNRPQPGSSVPCGKSNLFLCADGQVSFEVQNVYKGQKADMMIQQHIGSPSLLGQRCLVYAGPMTIVFNEIFSDLGKTWCL